jgi:hypothetical protein
MFATTGCASGIRAARHLCGPDDSPRSIVAASSHRLEMINARTIEKERLGITSRYRDRGSRSARSQDGDWRDRLQADRARVPRRKAVYSEMGIPETGGLEQDKLRPHRAGTGHLRLGKPGRGRVLPLRDRSNRGKNLCSWLITQEAETRFLRVERFRCQGLYETATVAAPFQLNPFNHHQRKPQQSRRAYAPIVSRRRKPR